mmetsp:Transcript_68809/g.188870  ORF Transcript_68809/g.188870 Transcript_68809/m.188870 type:complete len:202 (-) Transcript_68809:447-1052(-)
MVACSPKKPSKYRACGDASCTPVAHAVVAPCCRAGGRFAALAFGIEWLAWSVVGWTPSSPGAAAPDAPGAAAPGAPGAAAVRSAPSRPAHALPTSWSLCPEKKGSAVRSSRGTCCSTVLPCSAGVTIRNLAPFSNRIAAIAAWIGRTIFARACGDPLEYRTLRLSTSPATAPSGMTSSNFSPSMMATSFSPGFPSGGTTIS